MRWAALGGAELRLAEVFLNIVPACLGEEPVDHVDQARDLRRDPRLLTQLPQGRVQRPFAGLDPPSGQAPLSLTRRRPAPDQQYRIAAQTDDADGGDVSRQGRYHP